MSYYGTTSLTYDVIAERLVLVTVDAYAKLSRYQLRVSVKTPQAVNFAAFSTRYDADALTGLPLDARGRSYVLVQRS